ncbi:starch synthase [candidate division WOR-1 bacterium RIFOXYB2_FULL_42_35]|uniref:Glycogen synthase n=1 Tax=candidate division WOR-1 bacterium RIFOXYC2_FULL_41_25 TaxID=1802586 RepID=A0A1F4TMP2_UNCSA|nr:MAG: starch synthase [candidate division WOR-1 bacterium RIFOXYA2_FULL_41_14]OGC24290.1 MAG: starch synthase [candidate division WOR-1 bacterium RIFOXYB2_FULL_42_35]OGC33992.1 MAG: starch synthase [candidate division WOR-1 bacterium RIFOXYC2_FULL_41_25]OGC43144.1 MAG: starch synthase [candidate division WOR-1 bacterium RIFOXYD2_FULL_41_8]
MKILLISPEVVPFAKTGGLADVAGALPKALAELGHDVRVFLPRYQKVDPQKYKLKKLSPEIWQGKVPGSEVIVYFYENEAYFGSRADLYQVKGIDFEDNLERFTAYCQASLKLLVDLNWQPDIIHCNDWQSALTAAYLKVLHANDPFFQKTAVVYSIHNMGYLGTFPKDKLPATGLGWDQFTPDKLEFWGQIALIKAGLVYADIINTVSQAYAQEIQTEEFGHGLDGLLRSRKQDVFGIVNGLDYQLWDPAIDQNIPQKYSIPKLALKLKNKTELQKQNGLEVNETKPVIGLISRLADQKGLDILSEVLDEIMQLNCQLVVLGTGDAKYHEILQQAKQKYPQQLGLNLTFDAKLAQLIYAGSDMFLMPSRYEPCGLGQLISFKYGTVPIVRKTGGLADTVKDYDSATASGDGFVFEEYTGAALLQAVKRACSIFKKKTIWRKLQARIMKLDYSWNKSAQEYVDLYKKALSKKAK